jgi:hypothetical protein
MGYYIYQHDTEFHIKKKNFDKALQALKDACQKKIDDKQEYDIGFADPAVVLESTSLIKALNEFSWDPLIDGNGDIIDIEFEGEKMGAEELLFKTLAPFVQKKSHIDIEGSDSEWWQWYFDGKELITKQGRVVFDDVE